MEDKCKTGRVTIPTDLDVVPETLEILKKWGADAIRDCDGTDFPQELKNADAKIYSTYYTTRKDNAWAKANPDEVQQCYIMTGFYTAPGDTVTIPLNPYSVLGLTPDASDEEVKRAYRALAKKYHPDMNPGDAHAAEMMNKINAAYDQIKNPQPRTNTQQRQYQDDPFAGWYRQGYQQIRPYCWASSQPMVFSRTGSLTGEMERVVVNQLKPCALAYWAARSSRMR